MGFKDPQEITIAGIDAGAKKAVLPFDKALVAGFLAGAYIAFGGLVADHGLRRAGPEDVGHPATLFTGAVFTLGLVLVVDRRVGAADRQHDAGPARHPRAGSRSARGQEPRARAGRQPARLPVRRLLPRRQDRRDHRRGRRCPRLAAIATLQGAHRDRLADLPARRRLQLAGLPRGVDVARRRRHRRQGPGHLLPDHGLRRHGLRPRRGQHVLPAGRDLRRRAGIGWGDALQNWLFACRQPRRRGGLRAGATTTSTAGTRHRRPATSRPRATVARRSATTRWCASSG